MSGNLRTFLWRTVECIVLAAALVMMMPSSGHAYWRDGVWIEPGPYPYYRPPPSYYYGPPAAHQFWVPQHWDGYRWVPGHWRYY